MKCLRDNNLICASGSVGGVRPCQGRGRGFESRLALLRVRVPSYSGSVICLYKWNYWKFLFENPQRMQPLGVLFCHMEILTFLSGLHHILFLPCCQYVLNAYSQPGVNSNRNILIKAVDNWCYIIFIVVNGDVLPGWIYDPVFPDSGLCVDGIF